MKTIFLVETKRDLAYLPEIIQRVGADSLVCITSEDRVANIVRKRGIEVGPYSDYIPPRLSLELDQLSIDLARSWGRLDKDIKGNEYNLTEFMVWDLKDIFYPVLIELELIFRVLEDGETERIIVIDNNFARSISFFKRKMVGNSIGICRKKYQRQIIY